jgi:hypothetical protein
VSDVDDVGLWMKLDPTDRALNSVTKNGGLAAAVSLFSLRIKILISVECD